MSTIDSDLSALVSKAKSDSQCEDTLIRQYMPFIKSETAKFLHRIPQEGQDDELSIALFAFHEAITSYQEQKGAFLPYASKLIHSRLIDYYRREKRHQQVVPLDETRDDEDDELPIIETVGVSYDNVAEHSAKSAAKQEIEDFALTLARYDISITDVADNCPRQERTLEACRQVLTTARTHSRLIDMLTDTGKLPVKELADASGVERKTIERHRRYIVAMLLAYTNGFDIIRGHLNQVFAARGGRK